MLDSEVAVPGLASRLYSVWYRHMRVYTRNLISNGLPPFLEPVIFLLGVGLGLGRYIAAMDGVSYLVFLATALPVTSAMFTSAYECTFGTFVRLEFQKSYDGMLAAPVTLADVFIGELLWAGTKGLFFSSCVLVVMAGFGAVPLPMGLIVMPIGFCTGCMFGALSLLVTSMVRNINHFNFYFTGLLSPMFFFSGTVFPLASLPRGLRPLAELLPLTHVVRLARDPVLSRFSAVLAADLAFVLIVTAVAAWAAIRRLSRRILV
ncbi:MAG: ABC transporter permease [Polyangia bacterium]|jgi:lipooligosaccharide transport system permease protein